MSEYTGTEMEKIQLLFSSERGYQTPKLDVRGAVFKEGKILLVKEKGDQKWSLPGGYCDVGLSPSENVVKEIKEESGYDVIPVKLLSLLDKNKHQHPPDSYHFYKIFIQCEIIGGEPTSGIETSHVGFFSKDNLPPLSVSRNTEAQIHALFEFLDQPTKAAIFD